MLGHELEDLKSEMKMGKSPKKLRDSMRINKHELGTRDSRTRLDGIKLSNCQGARQGWRLELEGPKLVLKA